MRLWEYQLRVKHDDGYLSRSKSQEILERFRADIVNHYHSDSFDQDDMEIVYITFPRLREIWRKLKWQ